MRGRDPHDDLPTARPRAPLQPVPTIGQLGSGSVDWFWVWCAGRDCQHHAPPLLAHAIERWGADASSNVIRRKAVCSKCGHKGATMQHPSWANTITGYAPFPGLIHPADLADRRLTYQPFGL